MAGTDSVSVFSEGTFEEQIQELVNYIVRNLSEDERTSFIRPFQDALKTEDGKRPLEEDVERRRKVLSMVLSEVKALGEGSDKETEGFFNLIFSHLFSLYSVDSPQTKHFLTRLLQTIFSMLSENIAIKYRILSNLFNAIQRQSPLRLTVYNTLLKLAVTNDQLNVLKISQPDVERWIAEWDISTEEKSEFLKSIMDAYAQSNQLDTSYKYSLLYVRSIPSSSATAQPAAVDAIATALRLPSVFDFDPLFKLGAVLAAKDHELFSLLQIFLNEGLAEFRAWEAAHRGVLETYNLDRSQLEHKIRLLTLATLGSKHVGSNLSYTQIASSLQVESSEVEKWVIDVIRAGLLSGKLSQTSQTLHVTRSTARTFEREQWQALEKRLVSWKGGLAGVLEVVAAARKSSAAEAVQQVPQTQAQAPVAVAA